jgi:hypothetical protein
MEYAGVLIVSWTLISCIVFATQDKSDSRQCPACAHSGRDIVEDARVHLGWAMAATHWLPT